jgi:hypothetical protein
MSPADVKKAQGNMYHYVAEVHRLLNAEHPEIYKERIWDIVVSRLQFEINLANVGILTLSYNKMQPLAIELSRAIPQIYFPHILLSVGEEMMHIRKQPKPEEVSMRWETISIEDDRIRSNAFYWPGQEMLEPGECSQ